MWWQEYHQIIIKITDISKEIKIIIRYTFVYQTIKQKHPANTGCTANIIAGLPPYQGFLLQPALILMHQADHLLNGRFFYLALVKVYLLNIV
jgi:hypothetical protein